MWNRIARNSFLGALVGLALVLGTQATAGTISVDPVFFNPPVSPPGGIGQDGTDDASVSGRTIDHTFSEFDEVHQGSSGDFSVALFSDFDIISNPSPPSHETPFVADCGWQVHNLTDWDWTRAYLVMLRVADYTPYPTLIEPQSFGFDMNLDGMGLIDDDLFGTGEVFMTAEIGPLEAGGWGTIDVRYVLTDSFTLPTPGVQVLVVADHGMLPEPGVALLLGSSLLVAGLRRRG